MVTIRRSLLPRHAQSSCFALQFRASRYDCLWEGRTLVSQVTIRSPSLAMRKTSRLCRLTLLCSSCFAYAGGVTVSSLLCPQKHSLTCKHDAPASLNCPGPSLPCTVLVLRTPVPRFALRLLMGGQDTRFTRILQLYEAPYVQARRIPI